MHYTFILNPTAGSGKAKKYQEVIQNSLHHSNRATKLLETSYPSHATLLAQEAASRGETVIAVGGDGTVHEVLAGLVQAKNKGTMGILPLGTGNDFAKITGKYDSVEDTVQALLEATAKPVDYGILSWQENTEQKSAVFMNNVGIGFDALTSANAKKYKKLPGSTFGYLIAVLTTLRKWKASNVTIQDLDTKEIIFKHPLFLVTAGNGICSGGGFYLTPNAEVDDGLLDFCMMYDVPISRILTLLPKTFKGNHLGAPEITLVQRKGCFIQTESPLPIHTDGEVLTLCGENIQIEVVQHGINMLFTRNEGA